MKKFKALLKNDFRNILREPILILILFAPLLIVLFFRFAVPLISDLLLPYVNLKEYYVLISGIMLLLVPMLFGILIGFILLDERDENVLICLILTPLGKNNYLLFRLLFPTFLSFAVNILVILACALMQISLLKLIPISLLCSLGTPLSALYLLGLAGNKVEGLTLSKSLGIFMMSPIGWYFINSDFKILLGILPTYWGPVVLMTSQNTPQYLLHLIMGFLVNIGVLWLLINRVIKK